LVATGENDAEDDTTSVISLVGDSSADATSVVSLVGTKSTDLPLGDSHEDYYTCTKEDVPLLDEWEDEDSTFLPPRASEGGLMGIREFTCASSVLLISLTV
jgi:hypothetical protein